jgi:hypothetical protein
MMVLFGLLSGGEPRTYEGNADEENNGNVVARLQYNHSAMQQPRLWLFYFTLLLLSEEFCS